MKVNRSRRYENVGAYHILRNIKRTGTLFDNRFDLKFWSIAADEQVSK